MLPLYEVDRRLEQLLTEFPNRWFEGAIELAILAWDGHEDLEIFLDRADRMLMDLAAPRPRILPTPPASGSRMRRK